MFMGPIAWGALSNTCHPLEGQKPSTVARPPFTDQSAPRLLAAHLRAALNKHKCLPQYLSALVAQPFISSQ